MMSTNHSNPAVPRSASDAALQAWETRRITRAISIRQPYAELILRGCKTREFRSVKTDIRERVYIYAGLKPGHDEFFEMMGLAEGDLPAGVLIGTVEVVDCVRARHFDGFAYVLENPRRLTKHLKPTNQP